MTIVVIQVGAWRVEWAKEGIYFLLGPGYRRGYGPFKDKAIAACKRKAREGK